MAVEPMAGRSCIWKEMLVPDIRGTDVENEKNEGNCRNVCSEAFTHRMSIYHLEDREATNELVSFQELNVDDCCSFFHSIYLAFQPSKNYFLSSGRTQ